MSLNVDVRLDVGEDLKSQVSLDLDVDMGDSLKASLDDGVDLDMDMSIDLDIALGHSTSSGLIRGLLAKTKCLKGIGVEAALGIESSDGALELLDD